MKKNITLSLLLISTIILAWCTTKIDTPEITETITSVETWSQTGSEIITPEIVTEPIVEQEKPTTVKNMPVEETKPIPSVATPIDTNTGIKVENPNEFTLEDVSKHNKKSDCWTAINWNVYDITSAFGKHPWWDWALLGLCGVEWTTKFNKQHGTNEKAKWRLTTLKIGTLK